ncbi:MAG: HpcH/HpaI aldolase/citrate lyase family protein [Haloferacaceae archaeon]
MEFRERLRAGEPVVGNWLTLSDPAVGEISAGLGFDFVVVDTEHSPSNLETVTNVIRGVEAAGDTAPLVRVPWNDHVRIKRVLDVGPAGLMSPMVDTAAEAESFVEAARYPPEGRRGVAGARAADYGLDFPDYVERANDELVLVTQIESETAVENAGDIAAVDGIDALFVGPADLSTALGDLGGYYDDRFVDAVERVLDAAHAEGVPVGTLATSEDLVERWAELGYDYQLVGVDANYVVEGSQRAKSTYEDLMDERE